MINGLVLFAKTGGSTLALEDIVRPVAYHEASSERRGRLLCNMDGRQSRSKHVCCDSLHDFYSLIPNSGNAHIDILHGSLPTEAEYARIVRRELGEESGATARSGGQQGGIDRERVIERLPENLYEQIYELAKEIKPKFLFFEFRKPRRPELVDFVSRCSGKRESSTWDEHRREVVYHSLRVKLTELGYDCRWDTLSAHDVGSPQKRERVYLLARKRGRDTEKTNTVGEVLQSTVQSIGKSSSYLHGRFGMVERTPERLAEVKAGIDEVCVPQYREAFLRLTGLKEMI
jgi:site-specific DNA-cytosine methylase